MTSLWTSRTSAANNYWTSVTYGNDPSGNGLFVAVSKDGTNRVMTSPDGITWTPRTAAENNSWRSVTYGNGLFVAVASYGNNRVMTSPDGITWTSRTATADNFWTSVTYGDGLFVAVASNRVMTSPDGITWTSRTAAENNDWQSVTYGNNLFVAVAFNRVMTSPDGITWTSRTAAENNSWLSVTYGNDPSGNGLFVAVASYGNNRVMTASTLSPTISDFTIPAKTFGDVPFTITDPTSNSMGSFSYTSSNQSVATVSGNLITIVGGGTTTITATQSATTNYTEGTITAVFNVFVNINNINDLQNFLNSNSKYGNILNNINIDYDLITQSYKVLTGDNIKIFKTT